MPSVAVATLEGTIMSNDEEHESRALSTYDTRQPPAVTPTPSIPTLPSSSGAWLGTRTRILKKDRDFIEVHTNLLKAKREQTDAMTALIESRMTAALTIAKLSALPEIAEHHYRKGRAERSREVAAWQHEDHLAALARRCDELDAQASLVRAAQRLADLQPKPPEPPSPPQAPPPVPSGLSTADVEKVAQNMPELKPETIQSLLWALNGLLAEKSK